MRDSSILIDEEPLMEAFVPQRLLHREGQLKEIVRHIEPALHGKDARNVLIVGKSGSGKTSLVKWILKEYFDRKHAYVNCLNYRSEHKILENILIQLGHVVPENKPTDYLAQRFANKVGSDIIVCLDEVDQIKDQRILQILSVQRCGVILVTNRPFFFDDIEGRVRVRLFLAEVEFQPYAQSELVDIIKDRIRYALKPDCIPHRLIELIAACGRGDARVALQTVRAAAMSADSKGREQITLEDLREAFKSAKQSRREYIKSKLNTHEKFLLELIERRKKIPSGERFDLYRSTVSQPLGERAYRVIMNHLVQTELVNDIREGRWKRYVVP